jgi:hypothetical protein
VEPKESQDLLAQLDQPDQPDQELLLKEVFL